MLINVGTCPLHTVSNAFLEGPKVLDVDLDQFAVDLHSFFKFSAKRVQEFLEVETEAKKMQRHVTTRWLSIQNVLVKILDQFENLKTYFLVKLPAEPDFNYKNGVANTTRYQNIKKVLTKKKIKSIMSAVACFAQDFKSFVVPLQTTKPLIPILYDKLRKLLLDIFSRFLKDQVYLKDNKLVSMKKISEIDFSDKDNLKVIYLLIFYIYNVDFLM